jgi:hypothetical protein
MEITEKLVRKNPAFEAPFIASVAFAERSVPLPTGCRISYGFLKPYISRHAFGNLEADDERSSS